MKCKACGINILGKPYTFVRDKVIELLCWPCKYWSTIGKVYQVR